MLGTRDALVLCEFLIECMTPPPAAGATYVCFFVRDHGIHFRIDAVPDSPAILGGYNTDPRRMMDSLGALPADVAPSWRHTLATTVGQQALRLPDGREYVVIEPGTRNLPGYRVIRAEDGSLEIHEIDPACKRTCEHLQH